MKIEDIKRDREAGTPGPWETDSRDHDAPYQDIKMRSGRRNICNIWIDDAPVPDYNFEQLANARRIARAPELEAAFLEAVELLGKVGKADPWSRDVIDFLERFK